MKINNYILCVISSGVLFIPLLSACRQRNVGTAAPTEIIQEYIRAVQNGDLYTMQRLDILYTGTVESVSHKELQYARKMTPSGFIATNSVIDGDDARIEGTATYLNNWNTNKPAAFILAMKSNHWMIAGFEITVDDDKEDELIKEGE